MQRRNFIRLVGGGTVAAAVGPMLAGCSTEPPAATVAAWAGPAPDAELRRWAVAHAILAPNSHNLQPWRVDLRETGAITLRVDRERLLPETDPWFRQIVVGQGTFLELLVLALKQRGVQPQVALFPEGEFGPRTLDDRPVARVQWVDAAAGSLPPQPHPLFAQVLRRHTAKVPYDTTRPVADDTLAALLAVTAEGAPAHLQVGATREPARVAALRTLALDAARVEVGTARTQMETNRLTRVGPEEIETHRDGIALNGLMPRVAVALGVFDRSQPPQPGSMAFQQVMQSYESHASTAAAFSWITTAAAPGATRSAEVWAGRLFVRQQLQAAALGLQVHPMSQAQQEFAEMQPHRDELHRQLAALDGRGAADQRRVVQMFCRIGYCAPQPHTPRRPLDSIVLA